LKAALDPVETAVERKHMFVGADGFSLHGVKLFPKVDKLAAVIVEDAFKDGNIGTDGFQRFIGCSPQEKPQKFQ
jgi:hypothetical protein